MHDMRILVIWGESLAKPGSGTTHCRGLAEGWMRDGHDVKVFCPQFGSQPRYDEGLPTRPIRLPRRSVLSFALFQLLSVCLLPIWLYQYRPDIVYVRACFLAGLQAVICRAFGAPLVGEVDAVVDEEMRIRGESRLGAWLIRGLDRINNRLVYGLVCVTRGIRDEVIRRGGAPKTTIAIPNGAPTDFTPPLSSSSARQALSVSPDDVVIAFAGYFAPWQGLELLLDAIEKLTPETRGRLTILLLGDGALRKPILQRVAAESLDDVVQWLPPGGPQEVQKVLAAADAAVIPIHDPRKLRYGISPLKFWEALAMGIGVLVPKGAQLDDVLESLDVPGLFDPSSADSLAVAITRVVKDVSSLRSRRKSVAERVAARYSWLEVSRSVALFMQSLQASHK